MWHLVFTFILMLVTLCGHDRCIAHGGSDEIRVTKNRRIYDGVEEFPKGSRGIYEDVSNDKFFGRSPYSHRQLAEVLKHSNESVYETHPLQHSPPYEWADSGPEIPAEIEYTPVGFNFCFPHNSKYCPSSSQYYADGRLFTVSNPRGHVSVLEPFGGCGLASPVSTTAQKFGKKHFGGKLPGCRVAVNAGFFRRQWTVVKNFTTNETEKKLCGSQPDLPCSCLGNLVSQGRVVRNTSLQNANFGIRDGSFIIGYLSADEVINGETAFDELVTGVVWLVRNGSSYVDKAAVVENANTQGTSEQLQDPETPYTNTFIDTFAARTAIGHDIEGRLMILQIDGLHGRNWPYRGIDLHNLAKLLIKLGFHNAINLDGGGSSTSVVEDRMTNLPSDLCPTGGKKKNPNGLLHCERPVSSIICIHDSIPAQEPSPSPETNKDTSAPSMSPSPGRTKAKCPPVSTSPSQATRNNDDTPASGYTLIILTLIASISVNCLVVYAVGVKQIDLRRLSGKIGQRFSHFFQRHNSTKYLRVDKSNQQRELEISEYDTEEKNILSSA